MSYMPWQRAEVPGTKKGIPLIKAEVLLGILKKSKRTVLVVGHKAVEMDIDGRKLIDYLIDFSNAGRIPVIATAHTIKEFLDRKFNFVESMPAMDIANRLLDPDWKGLDGKGAYDLAIFAGLPYHMGWLILSGLKHYPKLKTISIDGFFQPNASWSTPNISSIELKNFLDTLILKLGEKQ
jgi:acetyl-CoA decarbonylase/synthase complex subunit epsilon